MDSITKKSKPSYRTSVNKPAIAKEAYMILWLLLRNKTSDEIPKKRKIGSVTPSDELIIMCGWNANNDEPIKEYSGLKNLLQRKYTGIIVTVEIIIEEKRCNSIKKNGSSSFVLENKTDKNMDQPLLVK